MPDRAESFGNKVVYQVYIKSFSDSNGDGIGDLRGIIERLNYLQRLGVDCIWINPFFPSPQRDNGYDVTDYCAVDPMFGTMDDFDELVREARKRGIGIMLDMVFNHTSTEHPWFKRALAGDPKYLAYYKFVDAAPQASAENPGEPPTSWDSLFGGSAWQYVPQLNKWYLHLFDPSQADLNWDNPEVRAELTKILRFWRDRGVAGYRFDVANFISKPEKLEDSSEPGTPQPYVDGPHVHEYLAELVREAGIEGMMTVGEMGSTSVGHAIRYTAPASRELTQIFTFDHMEADYPGGEKWAIARRNIPALRETLRRWQEGMAAGGGWSALYWSNHDQPRPNSRFGDVSCEESWHRTSTLLPTCLHLMRGTPYVYQGEELGMTNPGFASIDQILDVESKNAYTILQERGFSPDEAFRIVRERSRDNSRTPMQWDDSKKAGFSTGTPWMVIAPNHTRINAAAEENDPGSVLAYYRRIIQLRKKLPVIQLGDVRFLEALSDSVIAYERTLDDGDGVGGAGGVDGAPETRTGAGESRNAGDTKDTGSDPGRRAVARQGAAEPNATGTEPRSVVVACNFSGERVRALPDSIVNGMRPLISNCDDWQIDGDALVLGPWTAVALCK